MKTTTLAKQTDSRMRPSALLKKAGDLGLDADGLERLAIQRGCTYYYGGGLLPPMTVLPQQFSNSELAVSLISPSLPPTARTIRLAAALLGGDDIEIDNATALAAVENCADVMRYIAECGHRFEPDNSFWMRLAERLPETDLSSKILPHPTRFVEMTGIDRGSVGLKTRWIRPQRRHAA